MTKAKTKTTRRLGRGLDSLVTDLRSTSPVEPPTSQKQDDENLGRPTPTASRTSLAEVPVGLLTPNPYQPRRRIPADELQSLADSIVTNGMINPITVRQVEGGYQIIAGERRWQASRHAGLSTVPITIKDADDRQMHELALVENIQREDLNAIDRASAYRSYCERFAVSAEELALRLAENRTTVTNYLRLLDLPEEIQAMVANGILSMGHARCIVGVTSPQERVRLAKAVVDQGLSVRALEEAARRSKDATARSLGTDAKTPHPASPHLRELEDHFSTALGTRVQIQEGRGKNTGRIVIEYYSLSDFDRIASAIGLDLDH